LFYRCTEGEFSPGLAARSHSPADYLRDAHHSETPATRAPQAAAVSASFE
jgi:hypothetical protein